MDAPRTLQLYGELDIHQARELVPLLSEAVGDAGRELVVDLQRVTFMDSTALGALVRAGERLRQQGRVMGLVVTPGSQVDGLLESTGLAGRFELLTPAGSAAGSMPGPAATA
jgi:anti-anti-sigma factor